MSESLWRYTPVWNELEGEVNEKPGEIRRRSRFGKVSGAFVLFSRRCTHRFLFSHESFSHVFRYNNRKKADKSPISDSDRFKLAMSQVAGRSLTYADLTGRTSDTTPQNF